MAKSIRRFVFSALIVAFAAAPAVLVTGCKTVQGAGEDIKNVGEAGERVIDGD